MTNTEPNVVSMKEYKTSNSSAVQLAVSNVLEGCREILADRLSQPVFDLLNQADDLLFDLVQKSAAQEHWFYFDAMRELRLKRSSIESSFQENLANLFNHENMRQALSEKMHHPENLDIEESLALNATIGKINQVCRESLLSLDQKMNELLTQVQIPVQKNPMGPDAICKAFHNACQTLESGIEIKLILFKLFEKYVALNLDKIYPDIDSLIAEKRSLVQKTVQSEDARLKSQLEKAATQPVTPRDQTTNVEATRKQTRNTNLEKDKNYYIVANRVIRNEINKYLNQTSVPDFVKNFLLVHWNRLLLKIYIKEGTESNAWKHAIEVIDELTTYVNGAPDVAEIERTSKLLPNLLQRLKFGMNVIPVNVTMRNEFIKELKDYYQMLATQAKTLQELDKCTAEDITHPSLRSMSTSSMPFMNELLSENKPAKKPVQDDKLGSTSSPFWDELLVDNKPGKKTDFDLE